jgi:putative membrane protein
LEEEKIHPRVRNRRVHLANERTFLSWIRTSIGIMAFGFVVEKFALFVRQLSIFLGKEISLTPHHGYSSFFGAFLIALGAVMGFLAFIRYKSVEKQIDEDTYKPSILLDILLVISLLAIAIFLIIYMLYSI